VVDDRDKEPSKGQERPSRPVTAAARRERRASARPAARKESPAEEGTKPARSGAKSAEDKVKPKAKAKSDADAKTAPKKGEHKGRPTPTRDRKESRPSIFARLFRFLREVVAELRKVIWPTRKQMITYTAVVLVFVAFMVALIAGLDIALTKGVIALFG
jgi:preprotein translocase subunit SecE